MTAEFAAVVPAIVLVLAACLTCLQVVALHVRLQDAAAVTARSVARGEPAAIGELVTGATASATREGDLVCVTASVSAPVGAGLLGSVPLTARSCAAAGGR